MVWDKYGGCFAGAGRPEYQRGVPGWGDAAQRSHFSTVEMSPQFWRRGQPEDWGGAGPVNGAAQQLLVFPGLGKTLFVSPGFRVPLLRRRNTLGLVVFGG